MLPLAAPSPRLFFPLLVVAEALTAFATLAFELAAARLVAPFAGASTDTWTAIIAAFLTALAAGSILAGRIAQVDAVRNLKVAALLCLAAGITMFATPHVLPAWDAFILAPAPAEVWRIAIFAAVPFLPAGFALGLVTPLLMTAALSQGSDPRRIGTLFAAGALGSLAGAWAALWWLLDTFGTRASVNMLALTCGLAGLLIFAAARGKVPQ